MGDLGKSLRFGVIADAAIELAARVPAARVGGAIEVRPVSEGS